MKLLPEQVTEKTGLLHRPRKITQLIYTFTFVLVTVIVLTMVMVRL